MNITQSPPKGNYQPMTNLLPELRKKIIAHANSLGHDMTDFVPNSDSQFLENSQCRHCDGWLFLRWDHYPPTVEGKGIPIEKKCLRQCTAELSSSRIGKMTHGINKL